MPSYSKGLSDAKILEKVEGSKKILIIGCGICTNMSLNRDSCTKEPFMNVLYKPYAMLKEIKRVSELLSNNNYSVGSIYIKGRLCRNSIKNSDKIKKSSEGYDTILVLGCFGGVKTVTNATKGKKIIMGRQFKEIMTIGVNVKGLKGYLDHERIL